MAEASLRERNAVFLWVVSVCGGNDTWIKKKIPNYLLSIFDAILYGCLVPAHHTPLLPNAMNNS